VSTASVLISNASVGFASASLRIEDRVEERTTANFVIVDTAGTSHYLKGQPVEVWVNSVLRFSGQLEQPAEQKVPGSGVLLTTCTCSDNHYRADKRTAAKSYVSLTAGAMVQDLYNTYLFGEGVEASFDTTNRCTPNQSNPDVDISAFATFGTATLTQDTATSIVGRAACKAFCSGSTNHQGVQMIVPISGVFSASTQYTVSAYIRGPLTAAGNLAVKFSAWQSGPSQTVTTQQAITLTNKWQRVSATFTTPGTITATGYGVMVETGTVTGQTTTIWIGAVQIETDAAASAWQLGQHGVTNTTVQQGNLLTEQVCNYITVAVSLDQISAKTGFTWWIDAWRILYFQQYTLRAAPWSISKDVTTQTYLNLLEATIKVTDGNPTYRNTQYALGGVNTTATQTETRVGDGNTQAWAMAFPLAKVPTIKVNGVTKTVGIKGVSTGKDFYWSKGDAVISQDISATKLINTDTLQVQYQGEFPTVAVVNNQSEISSRQSVEGFGTGIVEAVITSRQVSSSTAAFELCNAQLNKYGMIAKKLEFSTTTDGLAAGQVLTVTIVEHGLNNVQMLIETVITTEVDNTAYFAVTAILGPVDGSWAKIFDVMSQMVASAASDNVVTTGTNTVALLQTFPETWTWTDSFTVTVQACHFPGATLYPGATVYPC
jgi:hypothetical protein